MPAHLRATACHHRARARRSVSATTWRLVASATLGFALAACGGGGSSSSGGSNGGGTTPPPVVRYTLSVTISGNGSVTSSPAGINCGSTCSASFDSGTQVTLTATAASGSTFSSWTGACSGSTPTCTVAMTLARSVTASFTTATPGPTACTGTPPAPTTGLVNYGKALRPFSALAKPARGQRVADPDFPGTNIVRITDGLAQFKANVVIPAYPTTQAWNCNETRFVLYVTGAQSGGQQGWAMFDASSYAFIKFLPINPPDIEQFYWSHSDPAKLVYIDNRENGGTIIMKMMEVNVETGAQTVLHDFMPDVQAQGWPTTGPVRAGYPFYSGGDLELWGLGAGGIPNVQGQLGLNVFGFNAKTGKVTRYTGIPVAQARGTTPFPLKSGKGWAWPDWANHTTVVFDLNGTIVRTVKFDAIEHLDSSINAAGQDLLVGTQYDDVHGNGNGNLMVANLATGAVYTVIGEKTGDGYPRTSTLISSGAWKLPGWVAMGVTGSPYGSTADNGSNNAPVANPQTYIDQEVSIANVDTGAVFRVAHHRSTGHYSNAPVNNYWAQTNVTPSPSGTRILVQSDWGNANPKSPVINPNAQVDTYVIELPGYARP